MSRLAGALVLAACSGGTAEPLNTGASGGSTQSIAGASGSAPTGGASGTAALIGGAGAAGILTGGFGSTSGTSGTASISAGAAGASGSTSGAGTSQAGAGGVAGQGAGGTGPQAGSAGSSGFGGIVAGAAAASAEGGAPGGTGGSAGAAEAAGAAGSNYEPCPVSGPCKIMPFGDSITEGYPLWGGYRTRLFELAGDAGKSITFVGSASNGPAMVGGVPFPMNHEGHGGYTIDDEPSRNTKGISPFIPSSIQNYAPDIVTLMIGTNDINGNIGVADAPERLGALLDSIHAADADILVVLAQIVPTRNDGTNQRVSTYNAALPALVSERANQGRHLLLIDMYTAFTRDTNYKTALLGDDLHPNQAGYDRMAETWYAVLAPYLR